MFRSADGGPGLQIRGERASIVWGGAGRPAAVCGRWTIAKSDGAWRLTATLITALPFFLRQRPLLFEAPHSKGRWCWEVLTLNVGTHELRATLGPPVQ